MSNQDDKTLRFGWGLSSRPSGFSGIHKCRVASWHSKCLGHRNARKVNLSLFQLNDCQQHCNCSMEPVFRQTSDKRVVTPTSARFRPWNQVQSAHRWRKTTSNRLGYRLRQLDSNNGGRVTGGASVSDDYQNTCSDSLAGHDQSWLHWACPCRSSRKVRDTITLQNSRSRLEFVFYGRD